VCEKVIQCCSWLTMHFVWSVFCLSAYGVPFNQEIKTVLFFVFQMLASLTRLTWTLRQCACVWMNMQSTTSVANGAVWSDLTVSWVDNSLTQLNLLSSGLCSYNWVKYRQSVWPLDSEFYLIKCKPTTTTTWQPYEIYRPIYNSTQKQSSLWS
jgi:hypothetical protein